MSEMTHADPISSVLFWVTVVFFLGIIGRLVAQRFKQPGVLGELLMGMFFGNVCFYLFHTPEITIVREGALIFSVIGDLFKGITLQDALAHRINNLEYAQQLQQILATYRWENVTKVAYAFDIFSRYGVILLLFMVGLECSVREIRQTGAEAFKVASIGVCVPLLLGMIVTSLIVPEASFHADLFVGATLTATSVGITAKVFKELRKTTTREAKTILSAAVIDDVLGLMILAVVTGIVLSGHVDWALITRLLISVVLFFAFVIYLGPKCLKVMVRLFSFLPPWETKLVTAFIFLMFLSWLATCVGLASIIGAFAAGLLLHDDVFAREERPASTKGIYDLMAPLELILSPLFFMLIGMQLKIESFLDPSVLLVTGGLLAAAIVGKLFSGWGASRTSDRLLIGIGMMPRGEVGLVFASIGRGLGVLSDGLFSAVILMIMITTFIAPIWLTFRFRQRTAS